MNSKHQQVPTPIVLIGPLAAGKSTIGRLLAQSLALPHYELDERRWTYYAEMGYDHTLAARLRQEMGFDGLYQYWKPFDIHAVERVLNDCADGVISFGAGHSVYEDDTLLVRAERALQACQFVLLLLPSKDMAQAEAILTQRFRAIGDAEGFTPDPQTVARIAHFLRHPANQRLASHTIYTEGQTPAQTCAAILRLMAGSPET